MQKKNEYEKLEDYKMRKFLEIIYKSLCEKSEIINFKKRKNRRWIFGVYNQEKEEMNVFFNHCFFLEEKIKKKKN